MYAHDLPMGSAPITGRHVGATAPLTAPLSGPIPGNGPQALTALGRTAAVRFNERPQVSGVTHPLQSGQPIVCHCYGEG
jgi:hypothetical protein